MAKVGILGGTFDPVHNGHVRLVEAVLNSGKLDEVIIVPSGNPPHKFCTRVTPGKTRLSMLHLVFDNNPKISIWEGELGRKGYTFAVETVSKLLEERLSDDFYYIMGTDSAATVTTWKDFDKLKTLCGFVIAKRPGDDQDPNVILQKLEKVGAKASLVEGDFVEDSSTDFRNLFLKNKPLAEKLVPNVVFDYILKNNLYHEGPLTEDEIKLDLQEVLTEEKYIHSLGVSEEAERLAKLFGADVSRARLAGLLHDCAKCVKMSQLQWIGKTVEDFGAEIDYNGVNRRVVHGPLGAIVAERRYGITDPVVLDAIRNHVTGKPCMSLESMIIFIADYTEKNREGEFFETMRKVVNEEGLLKAVVTSCDGTIRLIADRGEQMDIRTVQTRNWAVSELSKLNNK